MQPVRELLKRPQISGNPTLAELNEWLAPRGLKAAVPLGFNNTCPFLPIDTGAVPAAVLALLMQSVFEWVERRLLRQSLHAG